MFTDLNILNQGNAADLIQNCRSNVAPGEVSRNFHLLTLIVHCLKRLNLEKLIPWKPLNSGPNLLTQVWISARSFSLVRSKLKGPLWVRAKKVAAIAEIHNLAFTNGDSHSTESHPSYLQVWTEISIQQGSCNSIPLGLQKQRPSCRIQDWVQSIPGSHVFFFR